MAFVPQQRARRTLPQTQRIRSVVGASAGNLVEWYDWYTYSAMTLYFAPAFFPSADTTAQLLSAAGIFAIGFLMRPLGSWLFGVYADRRGRKASLTLAVSLMCAGSLMIAIAPTHEHVGAWAPAWLVLARAIQGFSVGGEYGTSATYLSEVAPHNRRGFYSSFQYVTLIAGQLVALGVLLLLQRVVLDEARLEAWGWRIPFALGALAAVIVYYIRRSLPESEVFQRAEGQARLPALRELARRPRAVATVVGLTLGGTVAFYTYTVYSQKYLVNSAGLSRADATLVVTLALFVFMLLQPAFGALSDRIGRRPLLIAFGALGCAFTVPLLSLMGNAQTPLEGFVLVMLALLIVSGYTSINAVVKAELFPTSIRALGVGLPYALTVSLFGGTAEYVALTLKDAGLESAFFWYVSACIAISLLSYLAMRDTRGEDLEGRT